MDVFILVFIALQFSLEEVLSSSLDHIDDKPYTTTVMSCT